MQEDESQEDGADGGRLLGNAQASAQMSAMHSRQLISAMQQVQRNVTCIAIQPIVHHEQAVEAKVGAMGGGDDDIPYNITLSPNPNNVYILWQECKHGAG
eukprot:14610085-Ditylum_brightwellii.AAC.1